MITLRPDGPGDLQEITSLFIKTRQASMAYLNWTYDPEEMLKVFREHILPKRDVWLAELEGELAGFVAVEGSELDMLYVLPEFQGKGIGLALLEKAKELSPRGLELWVFQQNHQARRFYEREGFVLERLTDGRDNMEKVPDARYRWDGPVLFS